MLRIKVGGDIIETIGGNISNYAKGDIIYKSAIEVRETAPKIEYGKAGPHPQTREAILPLAVVEFLPGRKYKGGDVKQQYEGQFGFDYFRKKNAKTKEETPYFEALTDAEETGYYKKIGESSYSQYENRQEQYDALCEEYERHTIDFRPKKEIVKGWEAEQWYYYVPYLTLYSKEYVESLSTEYKPCYTAYLAMAIEIAEDIDSWEFEYDKTLFSHSLDIPLGLKKCKESIHTCNLVLTCLKDLDTEKEILLYAYPKGSKTKTIPEQENLRKLAGKIRVLPNSEKQRKKQKVLIMQIETEVNNDKKIQQGRFFPTQIERFYTFFYQACIEPEIEYYTGKDGRPYLDLTQDDKFKADSKSGYIMPDGKEIALTDREKVLACFKHLENYIPEDKEDYIVLYFFGLERKGGLSLGVSPLGRRRSIIYKSQEYEDNLKSGKRFQFDDSPVHEVAHALGVEHTFYEGKVDYDFYRKNIKYLFERQSTCNLMDYVTNRNFLYKWQWEIIRGQDKWK